MRYAVCDSRSIPIFKGIRKQMRVLVLVDEKIAPEASTKAGSIFPIFQ